MNKAVFFSVVYPGAQKWIQPFLDSLAHQERQDFDLFIINDNMPGAHALFDQWSDRLSITCLDHTASIAGIREYGINQLLRKGYEAIIFGDSDDLFEKNRVSKSLELLERAEIVVNDLSLLTSNGQVIRENYFSSRLENGQKLHFADIIDKNVFGMSNTAVRTSALKEVSFNDDIIAVDWFFFSSLLYKGSNAVFTNETRTFYRQHEENTAGLGKRSKEAVIKGLKAKYAHYKALRETVPGTSSLIPDHNKFIDIFAYNHGQLENYINHIIETAPTDTFWWEEIILLPGQ